MGPGIPVDANRTRNLLEDTVQALSDRAGTARQPCRAVPR
jgi:hypothetical protein